MIVFCYPDHNYESYADLKRLVALAGFDTLKASELEKYGPTCPVVAAAGPPGADWPAFKRRKSKYIYWDLEREPERQRNPVFDEEWRSDAWYAAQADGFRYVPLGSHSELADIGPPRDRIEYDLCHMSYESARRQAIYGGMRDKGLKLAPNGWGERRRQIIRSSRAMLCVHRDELPIQEPLRLALAYAYGIPVVMEECAQPFPWTPAEIYAEAGRYGNHEELRYMTLPYETQLCNFGYVVKKACE